MNLDVAVLRGIAARMGVVIDSLRPVDADCPYPLNGAVNVPLPFEEDPE